MTYRNNVIGEIGFYPLAPPALAPPALAPPAVVPPAIVPATIIYKNMHVKCVALSFGLQKAETACFLQLKTS